MDFSRPMLLRTFPWLVLAPNEWFEPSIWPPRRWPSTKELIGRNACLNLFMNTTAKLFPPEVRALKLIFDLVPHIKNFYPTALTKNALDEHHKLDFFSSLAPRVQCEDNLLYLIDIQTITSPLKLNVYEWVLVASGRALVPKSKWPALTSSC